MQEHLQTIMDTIVMPVVASLGGVAGIVAIITAIAKIATSAKVNNKAVLVAMDTKNTVKAVLDTIVEDFQKKLEKHLNCTFEVDFSKVLSEDIAKIEKQFLEKAEAADLKLNALRILMTDIAQFYSTSRNLTEEERLSLIEHIAAVNALVKEKPIEPKKDAVIIEFKPTEERSKEAVDAAEKPPKRAYLRGI